MPPTAAAAAASADAAAAAAAAAAAGSAGSAAVCWVLRAEPLDPRLRPAAAATWWRRTGCV